MLTCLYLVLIAGFEWADVGGALLFVMALVSLSVRFWHSGPASGERST